MSFGLVGVYIQNDIYMYWYKKYVNIFGLNILYLFQVLSCYYSSIYSHINLGRVGSREVSLISTSSTRINDPVFFQSASWYW